MLLQTLHLFFIIHLIQLVVSYVHIQRASIEAQEMISDCIINKYDSLSHSKYPQPVVHQEEMAMEIMSPIHAGILAGLVMCRPCIGNHSYSGFRLVETCCVQKTSFQSFPSSNSYILSASSPVMFLSFRDDKVNIDVSFKDQHPAPYSQHCKKESVFVCDHQAIWDNQHPPFLYLAMKTK